MSLTTEIIQIDLDHLTITPHYPAYPQYFNLESHKLSHIIAIMHDIRSRYPLEWSRAYQTSDLSSRMFINIKSNLASTYLGSKWRQNGKENKQFVYKKDDLIAFPEGGQIFHNEDLIALPEDDTDVLQNAEVRQNAFQDVGYNAIYEEKEIEWDMESSTEDSQDGGSVTEALPSSSLGYPDSNSDSGGVRIAGSDAGEKGFRGLKSLQIAIYKESDSKEKARNNGRSQEAGKVFSQAEDESDDSDTYITLDSSAESTWANAAAQREERDSETD